MEPYNNVYYLAEHACIYVFGDIYIDLSMKYEYIIQ